MKNLLNHINSAAGFDTVILEEYVQEKARINQPNRKKHFTNQVENKTIPWG